MTDSNRTQMLQGPGPNAGGAIDPNKTMLGGGPIDPNKTIMGAGPGADLNLTQTIKPIQCPVCKTFNPAGMIYCVECGLIFEKALDGDAFGAPAVEVPILIDENGHEYPVRPGDNVVGREGDIQVADGRVSRRHAKVFTENGQVFVSDLGSTNGTKVDGQAVASGQNLSVPNGGKISFGGFVLALQMPGGPSANSTQQFASNKTAAMTSAPRDSEAPAMLVGASGKYPLKAGINSFGRKSSNDVVIHDPYVSGSHGQIEVGADGFFLVDVGSTNGTVLNDAKLAPNMRTLITPDDVIKLGSLEFKVLPSEQD